MYNIKFDDFEKQFDSMSRTSARLLCVVLAAGAGSVDVMSTPTESQILAGGFGKDPEEVKAQLLQELKEKGYDTDNVNDIQGLDEPKIGFAELYATRIRDERVLGTPVGVWLHTLGAARSAAPSDAS